jgi:hypothetical protein
MPAQKIRSLLASGELGALCGKARRLAELQQAYSESAPPPLAQASRVSNCRAGTLFLLAENASVANKLRQLAPRLLANMRKREPEITAIRIGVQVSRPAPEAQRVQRGRALSPEAVEIFRKLSETMPASPLAAALTALVRNHDSGEAAAPQATSTRRSRT